MKRLASLIAAPLIAGSVFAAEPAKEVVAHLNGLEGTVLVSQKDKFVTAEEGQALQAGDRVLVMEGAQATVGFVDGCEWPVEPGSHLVVPATSTCAGAVAKVDRAMAPLAQAVGDTVTIGGSTWTVTNVIMVAGVVTAIVVVNESTGEERRVSP